jgi:hypothetical protein
MTFANNLLNVSVENIEVSAEELGNKLKAAWGRFVVMWKKFVDWFKGVISKLRPTKLPVEVSPETSALKNITRVITVEIEMTDDDNWNFWANKRNVKRISEAMKTSESLETMQTVNAWKSEATKFINTLSKRIAFLHKNFQRNYWHIKDPVIAARYYMSVGPKIIAKLQATLNKLADVKESPKAEAGN